MHLYEQEHNVEDLKWRDENAADKKAQADGEDKGPGWGGDLSWR